MFMKDATAFRKTDGNIPCLGDAIVKVSKSSQQGEEEMVTHLAAARDGVRRQKKKEMYHGLMKAESL
jgi:hypothetical protein